MTYQRLGRLEEALLLRQEVYSGFLKLLGEEQNDTLLAANNYAWNLGDLKRHREVKALMRKTIPVARRALGTSHIFTLRMEWVYARTLYEDDGATLDDLHEAVRALVETAQTARRVLGGAHPHIGGIEKDLRNARAALRARETPPGSQA